MNWAAMQCRMRTYIPGKVSAGFTSSFFSMTWTSRPARASRPATANPPAPPPITMALVPAPQVCAAADRVGRWRRGNGRRRGGGGARVLCGRLQGLDSPYTLPSGRGNAAALRLCLANGEAEPRLPCFGAVPEHDLPTDSIALNACVSDGSIIVIEPVKPVSIKFAGPFPSSFTVRQSLQAIAMDQKALEYTRNHYDRHSNQVRKERLDTRTY